MKKDLTEIVFILDESGSMAGLVDDTIGGFNSMIDKQRDESGEALVSTVLFSNESHVVHDRVPLDRIGMMTKRDYRPGGSTALFDAVGGAVKHIMTVHRYARKEDIPEHTIFIITTDGMENSSHIYKSGKVKDMISKAQKEMGWEFIFLGANIDSAETAESIGIASETAIDYCCDSEGTGVMYNALSEAVTSARKGVSLRSCSKWAAPIKEDMAKRR